MFAVMMVGMRTTMPSFDFFNALTLKAMADGQLRHVSEIVDDVILRAELSPEVLAEKQPSGKFRARDRAGWACSNLYRAGLLDCVSRGNYRISDLGRQIAPTLGDAIGEAEFAALPKWQAYLAARSAKEERPLADIPADVSTEAFSIDERQAEDIAISAVEALNEELAAELLQRLREGSPTFFELAVIKVLQAMGYGGKDDHAVEELRRDSHTGRSGDGGIDGVIKLDPLGVQNIFIQAKRYKQGNSVGRPDLQSFVGALHGKRCVSGVFITTSHYTKDAQTYAEREAQDRLVLIDGHQLASLMVSYGVGVQRKRTIEILQIDDDFFEY